MPEQTFSQVMSALSAKDYSPDKLARVYLVAGSEDSLKRDLIARLLQLALDPDFADFDHETIDFGPGFAGSDGESDPSRRVLAAAGMSPFMSPRRCVLVRSVQRLPKERQQMLAEGIKELGSVSLLMLVADASEFEAGRPKGRQVEAALKKAAATFGVVVNCEAPQAADLKSRAQEMLRGWGKSPDPRVIDALARHAAATAQSAGSGAVATLTRECEKLRSYTGDRAQITMADVDALMPDVGEESIFKMLDAVGMRNTRLALELVDGLLSTGERADGVAARTIVMLQRQLRMIMLGKFAAENRLTGRAPAPDEVKEMLSSELASALTAQHYRLPGLASQAAKFSWGELIWASGRVLAQDMAMKGIAPSATLGGPPLAPGDDPAAGLRVLVAQICSGIK